jgi:hypothetical protein
MTLQPIVAEIASQRRAWATVTAPPADHATVVSTLLCRSNPAFIDAIAERERREFEESLRAQVERLRSIRPA